MQRIIVLVLLSISAGLSMLSAEQIPDRGALIYQNNLAQPDDIEIWRMEGPGVTEFRDGWMEMYSPEKEYHHVFWGPKEFPDRFIAEWEAQNLNTDDGLCILFFAAKGMDGRDLFDPSLPKRDGTFSGYTKGEVGAYHISYHANNPKRPDRGKAHLRKNNGFNLVQEGAEGISGNSTAVHQLKLVKDGAHIRFFVDGRKVIDWTDTDSSEPRPHYESGKIGFRQMQWTHFRYRNFRVWEIEDADDVRAGMAGLPVIHAKKRSWADPAFDRVAKRNSPCLQWVTTSGKGRRYDVRLSQDELFPAENSITGSNLPWAVFNPHQSLAQGRWFWQHRVDGDLWSDTHSFLITNESQDWDPPPPARFLAGIPGVHPRRLVDKSNWAEFRKRAAPTREAERIVALAEHFVDQPPPEEDLSIADLQGDDAKKTDKIQKDASKLVGSDLFNGVDPLCKAYVLTGEAKYRETAVRWAMEASTWDPAGVTRINDFGDSRIMLSMATVYDTFHDYLDKSQRAALLTSIEARAEHFYQTWANNKESVVLSNHIWQHTFHYLFDTAIAVHGDIPAAATWLTYLYETFLARAPILGGEDGGWVHGFSYFRMNMDMLIDIPHRIKTYTGFDFIAHTPWYQENANYFLYGFPPGSASTGFSDNSHDLPEPRGDYLAYADALSRLVQNPYAAWYRDRVAVDADQLSPHVQMYQKVDSDPKSATVGGLGETDMLQWNRLKYLNGMPAAEPQSPAELPMARAFKGVGLVTMHSQDLSKPADENFFVSMRASPFGTYSHMLSDNNTFNMVYGGDRLFYHTGFKVSMSAPHRLEYYKHTKSHNGILIDGEGQPYHTEAYGWVENFLTGDKLSYAVGNASNAYDSPGEEFDAGLKAFRRHMIMLRPDVVVIYDELEAQEPVEWSYLLHAYNEISLDEKNQILTTANRTGHARVYLTGSSELDWSATDEYEVPAENWRMIKDENGQLTEYSNNAWHFAARSKKARKMRFLAVYQVRSKNGETDPVFNFLQFPGPNTVRVGKWKITAALDVADPARIEIVNTVDGVAFNSDGGALELAGQTFTGSDAGGALLIEKGETSLRVQESSPEIPPAARPAFMHYSRSTLGDN